MAPKRIRRTSRDHFQNWGWLLDCQDDKAHPGEKDRERSDAGLFRLRTDDFVLACSRLCSLFEKKKLCWIAFYLGFHIHKNELTDIAYFLLPWFISRLI